MGLFILKFKPKNFLYLIKFIQAFLVDLIKVDIEGSEYEIFRDLIKFSDDFDNCIIETHYKKLSDKYIHLHQEMLKTIENHPNKLKFKLNYI